MSQDTPQANPLSQYLILFVTGDAPRTRRARRNLAAALSEAGIDGWPREIDLLEEPRQALDFGMFATPALLRTGEQRPRAVLYGDLSDEATLGQFLGEL